MTLQEHLQTFTPCLKAPRGSLGGACPSALTWVPGIQHQSSPAQQDPLPLSSSCCRLQRAGGSSHCFLTAFPFSPKNNQIYSKKSRILNLRRVIPITLPITTSSLLTADYKVFFNHVFQRKPILQRTHPSPTILYTCHRFCSLIFLFLLDNQGNIQSVCTEQCLQRGGG